MVDRKSGSIVLVRFVHHTPIIIVIIMMPVR